MIEVYKYLNDPSPQIMNDIFKLSKSTNNVHLLERQNPKIERYGLDCISCRASQIWQTFPIKIRDLISLKNFQP